MKKTNTSSAPTGNKGVKPVNGQNKKDDGPRINEEIRAAQVRVVGDNVPEQGIYSLADALKMAADQELDLVEISPNAEPPVCKIIDYQKFLYQQKKKVTVPKLNVWFSNMRLRN